jgi:hypothetical protein
MLEMHLRLSKNDSVIFHLSRLLDGRLLKLVSTIGMLRIPIYQSRMLYLCLVTSPSSSVIRLGTTATHIMSIPLEDGKNYLLTVVTSGDEYPGTLPISGLPSAC